MLLWRISRHLDLSGIGGFRAPGRWHYAGQPIVYLAATPASALLEICVHTSEDDVPPIYTLLRVEGPDLRTDEISSDRLPTDWIFNYDVTRSLGDAWLLGKESALLKVPSAVVPFTNNFLLNPLHPDSQRFKIVEVGTYPFDPRLKR